MPDKYNSPTAFYTSDDYICPLSITEIELNYGTIQINYEDDGEEGYINASSEDGLKYEGEDCFGGEEYEIKLEVFRNDNREKILIIGYQAEDSLVVVRADMI